MFGKMIFAVAVVGALVVACGPADSLNHNEGGSCAQDGDCGGLLVCQPIEGRQGDFCCPTPACSSGKENCQPVGTTATDCSGVSIQSK
jgi:hypothetical protein